MLKVWAFLCTLIGSLLVAAVITMIVVPDTRIYPADILVKNDNPPKYADAIILLMGDPIDRVPHAADLLKKSYGAKIVFVESESNELIKLGLRTMEGQMVYNYLTKNLGVAESSILFNQKTRVTSTQEEFKAIISTLDANKMKRVTIATSWYHSSRAAWAFEHLSKGHFQIESFPTATPVNWYRKEVDFLAVFNEYLKWPYYYFRYGLFT